MPSFDESVDIFIPLDGSKNVNTGSVVRVVFRRDHSASCSDVHLNSHWSRSRSLKCTVFEDKCGMNFPMKLIIPNARKMPFLSSGHVWVCPILL